MRLFKRVLDLGLHLTLALVRCLGSGDEVSRMCSSGPREQFARPTQHTCFGPPRHVRMALLMREHVRSDASVVLQICPQTETARFVPDAALHARYAHLTAFVQARQRQADLNLSALCRLVQARDCGVAAAWMLLRRVGREILERARGLPETGEFDMGRFAWSKVLHGACSCWRYAQWERKRSAPSRAPAESEPPWFRQASDRRRRARVPGHGRPKTAVRRVSV